jgi:hypothetical protein
MSTINQRQLMLARRIAQKLVVSGGLSDAAGLSPGPITHPVPMGNTLGQIVPERVSEGFCSCTRRAEKRNHVSDFLACFWYICLYLPVKRDVYCVLQVTAATQDAADREMAKLLAEAYDDVLATLQRNRGALDKTIDVLLEQTSMSGQQVRLGMLPGTGLHPYIMVIVLDAFIRCTHANV